MAAKKLTVHDTGPDGETSYELQIGRDIAVKEADEVMLKSGGSVVYAMHHYEAGKRMRSFISKPMYDQIRAANSQIDGRRRSLSDVKSLIENRAGAPEQRAARLPAHENRPWWAFWR